MRHLIIVVACCIMLSGCAPVTVQTPAGRTAYTADQIALRVNELENAAIQANATGALPVATTRTLVEFAVSADQTLAATPTGWLATVTTAWNAAKAKIGAVSNPALVAAMGAVDAVLGGLQ